MGFTSVKISTAKLRNLIERSDKTIAKLGRETGIPSGTISNWLARGEVTGIDADYFEAVVKALGVKPDDLKAVPNPLDTIEQIMKDEGWDVEKLIEMIRGYFGKKSKPLAPVDDITVNLPETTKFRRLRGRQKKRGTG